MSSVRQRPSKSTITSDVAVTASSQPETAAAAAPTPPPQPSRSQRALSQTLTSTANLANLLPTGTLLAFQMLTPVFTNDGACDSATRPLTGILLALLASSSFLACFTDSVASDGKVYHGIATLRGLWLFDYPDPSGSGLPDLREYRVRPIDWVHAVLSVLMFCVVALRDQNVVTCFCPNPKVQTKEVLDIVPVGIGLISSLLFLAFPTTRHGIGCPVTVEVNKSG